MSQSYTPEYYQSFAAISNSSAEIVAGCLFDLLSPNSVIDVGCGLGHYLRAFSQKGVGTCCGIEGPWIKDAPAVIPREQFEILDLMTEDLSEYNPGRFDLAISIEVAEHLPAFLGEAFVKLLCRCAPIVFFSAAIPHQGGTHHVNEQRLSYWIPLFEKENFQLLDIVRPRLWNIPSVDPCVKQNGVLFVHHDYKMRCPEGASLEGLDLVHPAIFEEKQQQWLNDESLGRVMAGRRLTFIVFKALLTRLRSRISL